MMPIEQHDELAVVKYTKEFLRNHVEEGLSHGSELRLDARKELVFHLPVHEFEPVVDGDGVARPGVAPGPCVERRVGAFVSSHGRGGHAKMQIIDGLVRHSK